MRHPVFEHDFAAHNASLALLFEKNGVQTTEEVARAAKHVLNVTLPEGTNQELTAHEAISAIGERLLPNVPDPEASRSVVAFLAALHLDLCGPLPVGNWGGFTTPEIVGCPMCVRLHHTKFVRTPKAIAYATGCGLLDPRWTSNDNQQPRWIRLMWHYRAKSTLDRAVASLTPHGFWIDLDTEHRVLSAVRPLTGDIGRARRFGESQFAQIDMTWYGAEVHLTPLTPAETLRRAG